MTWRTGALVASLAVALLATGPSAAGAAPALVERPSCAAPTPLPATGGRSGTGDTAVSFQVPATTWLRIAGGRLEAATNTGCAPRATDRIVGGTVAQALTFRTGDWRSPGVWHRR